MSSKITALTALSSTQSDDVLPVVDVHDTSMAPSGTTKQITVSNLTAATQAAAQAYSDANVGAVPFPSAAFSGGKWITQGEPQPAQILTEFQSGHGYTNNAGSTFTANNTSDFTVGSQSCSILTGGAGAAANVSLAGGSSFSTVNRTVRLRLKVDDITHMAGLNFFLGSSAFANNYKWAIQTTPIGSNYVISGQWLVVTLNWHDATVTGSPSRSALTDVRLQVSDDNTGNGVTARYQSIELVPDASAIFPNGVVSVTFDDSYQDAWANGKPRLDFYGYPASVYTIQDLIGGSGRLTLAELKNLQDLQGWELGGHAYLDADHGSRFTGATAAVVDSDLRNMKAWGDANGFRGSMGLAYPGGQYGLTTDSQYTTDIVRRYNAYARTVSSKTKETLPPGDPYRLRAISDITTFSGGYPPSNLTGAGGDFDKCASNQTWLILSFHEVVTGSPAATTQIQQSDFNTVIDSINSHAIPVLPIGDVLRKLAAGVPASIATIDSTAADIQPLAASAAAGSVGKAADAGHVHPTTGLIDGTAGDIKPLAAAAAAGAAGKSADASHVHPNTGLLTANQLQPSDHGLIAWNTPPYNIRSSDQTALTTAGTLYISRVPIPYATTVNKVGFYVAAAGSVLTSGQCFAALFAGTASGALLAATADQSANFATPGGYLISLTSGQPVAAGYVYVGFWFNGTTGPALGKADAPSALLNFGLSSTTDNWGSANTGLTTTAPGTLSASFTATSNGYWACVA